MQPAPMMHLHRPPLKHSGLGISSFIIAIGVCVLEFVLIIIAGVMESSTPGGVDEDSMLAAILGLVILGGLGVNLLGVGLGIAGLVQRDVKKAFSVLGVAFNGLIICGIFMLMVIGMMMA